MVFRQIRLAGRKAYHYSFSYDKVLDYYTIPLNGEHYLDLLISSADNSAKKGGWPELSAKAKAAFLESLMLSGGDSRCG